MLLTSKGGETLILTFSNTYLIVIVILLILLLFVQRRKAQRQRSLLTDSLFVGAFACTLCGVMGTITKITEDTIYMRLNEELEISVLKTSVNGIKKLT